MKKGNFWQQYYQEDYTDLSIGRVQQGYSRLNAFNTKLLRVLTRKRRDEISNHPLHKLTGMESLEDINNIGQTDWACENNRRHAITKDSDSDFGRRKEKRKHIPLRGFGEKS